MEKEIQIKKENILSAYAEADELGKQMLYTLFGKEIFLKITDRVKTFEDACKIMNVDPVKILPYPICDNHDQINTNNFVKAKILTKVLNEGWEPDWNNSNEYKWYPWFRMGSGFGFSGAVCVNTRSRTVVGSRLCFKTEELAEYAGKQFEEIYKKLLN